MWKQLWKRWTMRPVEEVSPIRIAPPEVPNVWKMVLLIYPAIDCETTLAGIRSRFSYTMTDDEISRACSAMAAAARAVHDASNHEVCLQVSEVVVSRVLTELERGGDDEYYWPSPAVTAPELLAYCARGQADSAMVYWPAKNPATGERLNFPYWGMAWGAPDSWTCHVGYSTVSNVLAPDVEGCVPGEVFVHEWLHPTGAYFEKTWGAVLPDLDGSANYRPCPACPAYSRDPENGYMSFYRDYMRGTVWNPRASRYEGITPSMWRRGSPRLHLPQ